MASGVTFGAAVLVSWRRERAYIRRSPWDLLLLFGLPPVVLAIVAAIFFAGVIRDIPVALVDMDGSHLSRTVERNLLAAPKIRLERAPPDLSTSWSLVRSAQVYCIVYIPPGLESRAQRHEPDAVLIYFNAAFQTIGSQAAEAARAAVQAAIRSAGGAASKVALHPPKVQVTIIGNSQQSFELFLAPLVAPLVLNLLLSCAAVFCVGRELADGTFTPWAEQVGGRILPGLIGKLAPYVVIYWGWCLVWTAYLAGWRGWGVQGSVSLLLFGQLLLFCATAAIATLLVALTRDTDTALSVSALYAGSGLSFAGTTLPVNGAPLFTRAWSAILPSTSYLQMQEQQLILGTSVLRSLEPLSILMVFSIGAVLIAVLRLKRVVGAPPSQDELSIPPAAEGFVRSFLQTLRVVATARPILSTIVFSVVLYGFYYPAAYKGQAVIKLPVAVVDQDRSPVSRGFLRRLDATREVQIAGQFDSIGAAQHLLRQDRVDGVIAIPHGLEASVLKGAPGGIGAWFKGAYLVRSRFLGQALSGAIGASLDEALEPLQASRALPTNSVSVIQRPLYDTTNGYGDYTVPGVASIILQATLLFGVAMYMGLRRERSAGRMTLRAFLGVWSGFTLLGTMTTLFFFGFVFWFQDYPRAGNIPGMLICAPLFSAAVSAFGLLVGSAFERHERSMQILAGTSIPFFFLAGLSWPAFEMPAVVQALARLIPSTEAVPLFVELNSMGATLGECASQLVPLVVLVVLYAAAAFLRLSGRGAAPISASAQTLQHL
jgi:ABC-2 type transport system permease protein